MCFSENMVLVLSILISLLFDHNSITYNNNSVLDVGLDCAAYRIDTLYEKMCNDVTLQNKYVIFLGKIQPFYHLFGVSPNQQQYVLE